MTLSTDTQEDFQNIEVFNLSRDKNGINGQLSSQWWCCGAVYVSDVCIALHLFPNCYFGNNQDEARKSLYRLLRNVWATAQLSDLVRPVAAVISDQDGKPVPKEHYGTLHGWSTDQGWHRGHFCLYPVPDVKKADSDDYLFSAGRILSDLLSPEPEQIGEIEPISQSKILDDMKEQLSGDTEIAPYIGKLETWWNERDDKRRADCSPLSWFTDIRRNAENLVGGKQ